MDTNGKPVAAVLRRVGASRLDDCHGWNWEPRQVDDEDASPFRQVARIDPAIVRFDAPSAEGEAEAQTGLDRRLRCSNGRNSSSTFPPRQTAAFVLDPRSSTRSALAPTLSVTVV